MVPTARDPRSLPCLDPIWLYQTITLTFVPGGHNTIEPWLLKSTAPPVPKNRIVGQTLGCAQGVQRQHWFAMLQVPNVCAIPAPGRNRALWEQMTKHENIHCPPCKAAQKAGQTVVGWQLMSWVALGVT